MSASAEGAVKPSQAAQVRRYAMLLQARIDQDVDLADRKQIQESEPSDENPRTAA